MIQKKQKDEASDENCQAWYDKQKKSYRMMRYKMISSIDVSPRTAINVPLTTFAEGQIVVRGT